MSINESFEPVTTENDIMESIGEGTDESTTTEETESSAADTTTQESAGTDPHESTNEATAQEQTEQQSRGPQDLVGADGKVIAKGGNERRLWEKGQKLERANRDLTTTNSQLQTQVQQLTAAGNVGTQYGLNADELTTGAQLMKSFKDDPAGTAQYILTQAQSMGHNIEGAGSNDMAAMKQMIAEAIGPLTQARQVEQQNNEAQTQAQEQYNQFVGQYPDAVVHVDTLAQMLKSEPNLSPDAAYFKLKSFYSERGLDWMKTLDTLKAEQQQTTRPVENTQVNLPAGGGGNVNVTSTADVADTDVSMSDIIRQSMQEAGMKVN